MGDFELDSSKLKILKSEINELKDLFSRQQSTLRRFEHTLQENRENNEELEQYMDELRHEAELGTFSSVQTPALAKTTTEEQFKGLEAELFESLLIEPREVGIKDKLFSDSYLLTLKF